MKDEVKFDAIKQTMIEENERKFGAEIRKKYGDKAVNDSNARLKDLSRERYNEGQRLSALFEQKLKDAFAAGEADGSLAHEACDLHRQWLVIFYPGYNKDYHKSLGETYVSDERFRAYYNKIAPGCAEFLRDAINIYCAD